MKKLSLVIAGTLSILVGSLFVNQVQASAWTGRVVNPTGDVRVDASKKPDGSLYVFALSGDIEVTGEVKGDLYCIASDSVKIKANVAGSVNCASPTITLSGEVGEDTRLAAEKIDITSRVKGDLSSFATELKITDKATIDGDLNGNVSKLTVDGKVGHIIGYMNQIDVNNTVNGMDVISQSISLGSKAKVTGDLSYQESGDQAINVDKSKVDGKVKHQQAANADDSPIVDYLYGLLIVVGIVTSLVVTTLVPFTGFYRSVKKITRGKLQIVLLIGTLAIITVPVLLAILALTVIGLPVVLAIIVFWIATLIASIGYIVMELSDYAVGRFKMSRMASSMIAIIVISIVASIPRVGVLIMLLMLAYGSGSIIYAVNVQRQDSVIDSTKPKVKNKSVNKK